MFPAYFETHFDAHGFTGPWPDEFAIITAYATTGEHWLPHENETADQKLEQVLERLNVWRQRVTGFSPSTCHSEPGWAVELPFAEACDLGLMFRQDAIYYVCKNLLTVSLCDHRRGKTAVGRFSERLSKLPERSDL